MDRCYMRTGEKERGGEARPRVREERVEQPRVRLFARPIPRHLGLNFRRRRRRRRRSSVRRLAGEYGPDRAKVRRPLRRRRRDARAAQLPHRAPGPRGAAGGRVSDVGKYAPGDAKGEAGMLPRRGRVLRVEATRRRQPHGRVVVGAEAVPCGGGDGRINMGVNERLLAEDRGTCFDTASGKKPTAFSGDLRR